MNKSDLEDIASDRETENTFYAVAAFFGAGPSWLLVDKITSAEKFEWSLPVVVCSMAMVFGLVLFFFGKRFSNRAMSRVKRILEETKIVHPT